MFKFALVLSLFLAVPSFGGRCDIEGRIAGVDLSHIVTCGQDGYIHLVIFSPGGDSEAMFDIIDYLTQYGTHRVKTVVGREAASAASAIFLAADDRVITPWGALGYHRGGIMLGMRKWTSKSAKHYIETGKLHPEQIRAQGDLLPDERKWFESRLDELRDIEKQLEDMDQRLINYIASRIGKTALEVETLLFKDYELTWVIGEEAVRMGLATRVADVESIVAHPDTLEHAMRVSSIRATA